MLPNLFASGTDFVEDRFLATWSGGGGDGFGMIQVHYIYCVVADLMGRGSSYNVSRGEEL